MDGNDEDLESGCEDDMSKWKFITVEGGRVTRLNRLRKGLSGTISAEI